MNFNTEYPKGEVTIEVFKKKGALSCNHKAIIHYRNYVGWRDVVDYYQIVGDKNTWYGVKSDFMYDYLMCKVKGSYIDSFGRKMEVTKIK